MSFLDIEFPKELFPNFGKSIKYLTSVTKMQNGAEFRRGVMKKQIVVYSLVKTIKNMEMLSLLEDFFHAVSGRLYSFKMHDAIDFQLSETVAQKIGEYAVQIQKITDVQGIKSYRNITKPKEETVKVFKNNALMISGHQVDPQTGIVTFSDSIINDEIVVSCEYFKHVRFNADTVSYAMKGSSFEIENMEIIEVLN